jgi:hypothetical protein
MLKRIFLTISLCAAGHTAAAEWQHTNPNFDRTGQVTLKTLSGVTNTLSNTGQQGLQSSASPTVLSVSMQGATPQEAISIGEQVYSFNGNGGFTVNSLQSFRNKYSFTATPVSPLVNSFNVYGATTPSTSSYICESYNGFGKELEQSTTAYAGGLLFYNHFCKQLSYSNPRYTAKYSVTSPGTPDVLATISMLNEFNGDGNCVNFVTFTIYDSAGNVIVPADSGGSNWRIGSSCSRSLITFGINHYVSSDSKYQRLTYKWVEYKPGFTRSEGGGQKPSESAGVLIYHHGQDVAILALHINAQMNEISNISILPPPP